MTTRKLIALDESKPFDLGSVVEKLTPIGRPLCVDIGCPRDRLPMYWWGWGKESHVYNELLKRDLPAEANAYSFSAESIVLDGTRETDEKRDHHFVAVQLYRLE